MHFPQQWIALIAPFSFIKSEISFIISTTSSVEIVIKAEVPSCEIDGSSIKIIGVVSGFADFIFLICHRAFIERVFVIISFNVSS